MNETGKELSLFTNDYIKNYAPLSESSYRPIVEDSASVDKAVAGLHFRLLGISAPKAGQTLGRLTPKGNAALETVSRWGMSKGSSDMAAPRFSKTRINETREREVFASLLGELFSSGASAGAAKGKRATSTSSGASSGAAKGKAKGKTKNV